MNVKIYTIPKGHILCRHSWWYELFAMDETVIGFLLSFDRSCRLDMTEGDQPIWHRAFGFRFGPSRQNSYELQWHWSAATRMFSLMHMRSLDGRLASSNAHMMLQLGQQVLVTMAVAPGQTSTDIRLRRMGDINGRGYTIDKTSHPKTYFLLPRLGPNCRAPHDVHITMEKV